ncbi:MAG: MBL fold metallo-hydrolase [Clostridia bacterium]|nr:MBL fold metallo-hydrolase [Clostridia bacterium]
MTCYTLFSGSSGNCIYLKKGRTELLVDAGGSMKQIDLALRSVGSGLDRIDGILLTHEHSDHTKGIPMIVKHCSIPVYCQRAVAKELYLPLLSKSAQNAAALAGCIRTVEPEEEYEIGDMVVTPFRTPHDSQDSQGFLIDDGLIGIATDLGHVSDSVDRYLSLCKNVILESNHDLKMLCEGPYPPYLKERVASDFGHLNNVDSAAFSARLLKRGCRSFTLFHLSKENNTPELALSQTRGALCALGAEEGVDFSLRAASRFEVTRVL